MTVRYDPVEKRLECAVRDLVDGPDQRFGDSPGLGHARRQAGQKVHAEHQSAQLDMFAGYRREIPVRIEAEVGGVACTVSGRIDGAYETGGRLVVEEVKSVIAPGRELAAITGQRMARYEQQAKLYCAILAAQGERPIKEMMAEVVLVSVVDGQQHHHQVDLATLDPLPFIRLRLSGLLEGLRSKEADIARRQALAKTLPFPFPGYRPQQREFVELLDTASREGRHAVVSAPTGTGKTAGALLGMAKEAFAAGAQLFYVTPKNTQQGLVLETAQRWHEQGHPVRVVALRAKAKMCLNDVLACHPDLCPYARDYADKLARHDLPGRLWSDPTLSDPAAPPVDAAASSSATALADAALVTPELLQAVGRKLIACPFELGLDMTETADVIVGDYNYVFDPTVALDRHFGVDAQAARVGVKPRLVIDEAHALYDRGCDYYSPALWLDTFERARDAAQSVDGDLGGAWVKVLDAIVVEVEAWRDRVTGGDWGKLGEDGIPLPIEEEDREDATRERLPTGRFDAALFAKWREAVESLFVDYLIQRRSQRSVTVDDPIVEAAFELFRFESVVQLDGPAFAHLLVRGLPEPDAGDSTRPTAGRPTGFGAGRPGYAPNEASRRRTDRQRGVGASVGLRIHCSDPARQLAKRVRDFHSAAAISATLTPLAYNRRVLGFPERRTDLMELGSPFPAENLCVVVDRSVTTVYRERQRNIGPIADRVLDAASLRPGNYLAAFPSYAFLREVTARMQHQIADASLVHDLHIQRPGMSDAQRVAFLSVLDEPATRPRILAVVQGGIFSEGVDYPGDACIGVFVVGPALPRVGLWQELKKRYFDDPINLGEPPEMADDPGNDPDAAMYAGQTAHESNSPPRSPARKGFDYAYLFPGMTRVIQTAGRVIRTPTDTGFVALLDRRFASRDYQACFPRWWYDESPEELVTRDLTRVIADFWHERDAAQEAARDARD